MQLERTITIDRPAQEVFAVLADYSRDTAWRAGVREMTADPPGPAQVGTRTHEVLRFLGSTYVTDAAVTAYEPGAALAFHGRGSGGEVSGLRAVEPAGERTRVRWRIEVRMPALKRLGIPIMAPLMARRLDGDLRRLRGMLESPAAA